MTTQIDTSDPLLAGLSQADREAFAELYKRFLPLMIRKVVLRLSNDQMHGRIDPKSVAQAAWLSLWKQFDRGRLYFDTLPEVIGLLTKITTRKYLNRVREARSAMRDVRREGGGADQVPDPRDLEPDSEAVVRDLVEHVLNQFNDAKKRVIVLRLNDLSSAAVAKELQLNKKMVDRIMADFRDRFKKYWDRISKPLIDGPAPLPPALPAQPT